MEHKQNSSKFKQEWKSTVLSQNNTKSNKRTKEGHACIPLTWVNRNHVLPCTLLNALTLFIWNILINGKCPELFPHNLCVQMHPQDIRTCTKCLRTNEKLLNSYSFIVQLQVFTGLVALIR